jgi:tRNA(Ile)-lysidine synthase
MQSYQRTFFRVKEFIQKNTLIQKDDLVLLALSGGADSVCLFYLLLDLKAILPFKLKAIHINHQLRAGESKGDERFCRTLCKEHGISLVVRRANIRSIARKNKMSLEVAGRHERRRIFALVQKKYGVHEIALAHHANDQAETMCMRFFKGSMWEGLSGIRPREDSLIRPLLLLQKSEIVSYLRERKLSWREDSSNVDTMFMRNAIRKHILPKVEKHVNANVIQTLSEKASYFLAAQRFLERKIEEWWKRNATVEIHRILFQKRLRKQEKFMRLALVHRGLQQLAQSAWGVSLRQLESVDEEILKNIHGHRLQLAKGIEFRVEEESFELRKKRVAVIARNQALRRSEQCFVSNYLNDCY